MPNVQFTWHALSDKAWSFVFFQKLVLSFNPFPHYIGFEQAAHSRVQGWLEGRAADLQRDS